VQLKDELELPRKRLINIYFYDHVNIGFSSNHFQRSSMRNDPIIGPREE